MPGSKNKNLFKTITIVSNYIYLCIYIHMYIYKYGVCVCVYIYIYIYIYKLGGTSAVKGNKGRYGVIKSVKEGII